MNAEVTLKALLDVADLLPRLQQHGWNEESAHRRAAQFAKVAASLDANRIDREAPVVAFFVPGRIEVLGKHTDYAGGRSIVCAVDRGFAIVAVPEISATVHMTDAVTNESVAFDISSDLVPKMGHWSNYAATVSRRLSRNFERKWRGARIAFASDLPPAAGLSSSSALVIATFSVLSAINNLPAHPRYRETIHSGESLADYLGAVENGRSCGVLEGISGVGTFGGSEDHTAILGSEPGMLKCYAYAPTRFETRAALSSDWTFVIGSSGVKAEKTRDALARYNEVSSLAGECAAAWRRATGRDDPHLAAAIASGEYSCQRMLDAFRTQTDAESAERLARRFEHFMIEDQQVIPAAVDALSREDMESFANAVQQSQTAAERLLGNQIEATMALVRQAYDLGALAASAFGAGFGGSVWALVRREAAVSFCERWSERYRSAFPAHAAQSDFFLTPPAMPSTRIA